MSSCTDRPGRTSRAISTTWPSGSSGKTRSRPPRSSWPDAGGCASAQAELDKWQGVENKKGAGQLTAFVIEPFFWSNVAPKSQCFKRKPATEIERRECDDLSEMTWRHRSPTISCLYTRAGGSSEHILQDVAVYWYGARPQAVEAERLLKRSHSHPVLAVGDSRIDCPATKAEADATARRYETRLASLRATVPQAPPDVALPGSEWKRQQQEKYDAKQSETAAKLLRAFPIEGPYATTIHSPDQEKPVHRMKCAIL